MKYKFAEDVVYLELFGAVRFNCPCGEEIIMSVQRFRFPLIRPFYSNEGKECKCGRVYRFAHYVEIEEDSK